ncbi:MAG: 16S rRNA processing protein RimM [Alphaproteobacteria bacterium]|jgi:16S rRNA processing protein RimM
MAGANDLVALGIIGRPRGVKGLVHIRPYTAAPDGIAAYGPLQTGDGKRLEVEVVGVNKADVTARIVGITDRDGAAALTGTELFVPRAALPEAVEDEYYHHDLIGLRAVAVDGSELGRIRAVEDFGAGTMLEIELTDGEGVYLPFSKEAVPEVNVKGGRVVLNPPPGLWSAEGEDADEETEEETNNDG